MILIAVILLVLAVAVLIVGGLAWSGKLPGNGVVGLHIPEVRKSKELWVTAHRIAGPMWTFGGVALLFAAAFSFIASGWMWLLPVLMVVLALCAVGAGAGQAAHAVARIDARDMAREQSGASDQAPDLDALRRAARDSDEGRDS